MRAKYDGVLIGRFGDWRSVHLKIFKLIQLFTFASFPVVPSGHLLKLVSIKMTQRLFFGSDSLGANCIDVDINEFSRYSISSSSKSISWRRAAMARRISIHTVGVCSSISSSVGASLAWILAISAAGKSPSHLVFGANQLYSIAALRRAVDFNFFSGKMG